MYTVVTSFQSPPRSGSRCAAGRSRGRNRRFRSRSRCRHRDGLPRPDAAAGGRCLAAGCRMGCWCSGGHQISDFARHILLSSVFVLHGDRLVRQSIRRGKNPRRGYFLFRAQQDDQQQEGGEQRAGSPECVHLKLPYPARGPHTGHS